MRVLKFGGSSVADAKCMNNVYNIVISKQYKNIVVLSACKGVTDNLEIAAQLAKNCEMQLVEKIIKEMIILHKQIICDAIPHNDIQNQAIEQLNDIFETLSNMLVGISLLQELTPSMLDVIRSFGEQFSTFIFHQICVSRGLNVELISAKKLIITDSNYNNAEPLPSLYEKNTCQLINNIFVNTNVIITQGFIGADQKGKTTTLGRGGSDLTASLLGAALNAEVIEIWTDVDGFLSADPKICNNTKIVKKMSFQSVKDISFWGAKILHTKTIIPAMNKKIPVKILNTFNPTNTGTTILPNYNTNKMILHSITGKNDYILINKIKEKNITPLIYYGSNEKYWSIYNKNQIEKNKYSQNISVICIAGENITTNHIKVLEFLKQALYNVNVIQILYGISTTSILIIIKDLDVQPIVKQIHNLLINQNDFV